MRIRVKYDFGGKETKERRILPGDYDAGSPALFGLADYLVANGHAVVIAEVPQDTASGEVSETPPDTSISVEAKPPRKGKR